MSDAASPDITPAAAGAPATATAGGATQETTTVVEFTQVGKTYDTGYTAIKDVTFRVDDVPGHMEIVGILGPSGCGKSTVLRLIAGLTPQHPATTGIVKVMGKPVEAPGADRGFVFQDYTSFDHRTVEQNIAFGLECRGTPANERLELARDWIQKVGLDVKRDADKYPHELSGGMRQRVALARTLVLKPRVILMDEPFGALDPKTRYAMQDQLVALSREVQATVFLVTHSIEEAVYVGDRLFVFSNAPGTILQEMSIPAPDRPARVMQREPDFLDIVFSVRDLVEGLEMYDRAGT
ncbi:MAG: ABC transporter ATP-binding protein [Gemmatimonadetes bacterium]|nr:ABC transporter ATP-binding protein [Gemmatimonadota bacterium]